VRRDFNYPVLLVLSGTALVVLLLVFIFFGKAIMKRYRVFMMKRKHRIFTQKFYGKLGRLRDDRSDLRPEAVLLDWKKYMEGLEQEPFTKLTTRELARLHQDPQMADNLKAIDRYIYGSIKEKPMHEYFSRLLEYSVERFRVRIKEVQDGL
jgi:hypothetical protein